MTDSESSVGQSNKLFSTILKSYHTTFTASGAASLLPCLPLSKGDGVALERPTLQATVRQIHLSAAPRETVETRRYSLKTCRNFLEGTDWVCWL